MVEGVAEGLGGVLVPPVARVEDGAAEVAGGELGRTARGVADDEAVEPLVAQGEDGVLEGLALAHGGAAGGEVHGAQAQVPGGLLEAHAGAGGVLEEQHPDGPLAQGGHALAFDHAGLELGGVAQESRDLVRLKVPDAQQVLRHLPT